MDNGFARRPERRKTHRQSRATTKDIATLFTSVVGGVATVYMVTFSIAITVLAATAAAVLAVALIVTHR